MRAMVGREVSRDLSLLSLSVRTGNEPRSIGKRGVRTRKKSAARRRKVARKSESFLRNLCIRVSF